MAAPDSKKQQQMSLNSSKVLLMNQTEGDNVTGVTGFARVLQQTVFCNKF